MLEEYGVLQRIGKGRGTQYLLKDVVGVSQVDTPAGNSDELLQT